MQYYITPTMHTNELYHHGILGMHWGIRRYQPYPSGSKNGKEVGQAKKASSKEAVKAANKQKRTEKRAAYNAKKAESINRKADRKLSKIERKIQRKNRKAEKWYNKAEKRANNDFWYDKEDVKSALAKANTVKRKVNNLEYKGKRRYERTVKKLGRLNATSNEHVRSLGEKYLANVRSRSDKLFQMDSDILFNSYYDTGSNNKDED